MMINSEIRNWMLKPYVFIWALIPVRGRFQFGLWPRRKPFHSEAREQHLLRYWSPQHFIFYFSIWSFLLCSVEVHWISIWSSAWARFVPALCRRTAGYTLFVVQFEWRLWLSKFGWDYYAELKVFLSLVSSNIASVPSTTFGEDDNAKAKVQSCRLLSGPA